MIPVIFHIGPIAINSFGLMIALMFIAAVIKLGDSLGRNGVDPKEAETFVFAGVISGLLGARIWYLVEEYSAIKDNFWEAAFSGAGFTFYGGFVLALIVVFIICRRRNIPLHTFFDSVGPTLALGYAIGRLGCQLSGDGDYGIVTESFMGMSYGSGVVPTPPGVLVYPTPLFESAIALGISFYLGAIERDKRWTVPWSRFGAYLLLISLERFLIEFIRIKERYAFGLSEAHYFSILFGVVGFVLIMRHITPANEVSK